MVAEAFINTTIAGLNNPECAFYVGAMAGQAGLAYLIMKVAFIYYGLRFLEVLLLKGVPKFYEWAKWEIKLYRRARR